MILFEKKYNGYINYDTTVIIILFIFVIVRGRTVRAYQFLDNIDTHLCLYPIKNYLMKVLRSFFKSDRIPRSQFPRISRPSLYYIRLDRGEKVIAGLTVSYKVDGFY